MDKQVTITYCKPCGYERRARELSSMLESELGIRPTLVAGKGGIFEVTVNERTVAKRTREGFPETSAIVRAVRAAR